MPVVDRREVQGYASCTDPRCPGYQQEEVTVTREEVQFLREEVGGDIPGVDHSTIRADDFSVTPCPHCDKPRIASLEERPVYAPISGQDPLALLDLNQNKQIANVQTANLEQQLAMSQMQTQMAEMKAQMAEQAAELQRRKGGRPPKVDE